MKKASDSGHPDDRLYRLERSGLLRRSTRRLPIKVLRARAPKATESVLLALLDERRVAR